MEGSIARLPQAAPSQGRIEAGALLPYPDPTKAGLMTAGLSREHSGDAGAAKHVDRCMAAFYPDASAFFHLNSNQERAVFISE